MSEANRFLKKIAEGDVLCAEGYLFELERRGYLQAGAFVPEVVSDHPEVVRQLHLDFVRAGSDVVQSHSALRVNQDISAQLLHIAPRCTKAPTAQQQLQVNPERGGSTDL